MSSIGEKMTAGAVWMILFRLLEKSIGLISVLILARVLIPDDFGLVALATAMIALLELLSAFGFDMALIQNQKAERDEYDTAWTFNVIFGAVSAMLLAALAPVTSEFYSEPRLETVMYFLAAGLLMQGLENIGIVAFRKEMTFAKEFRFMLGKKLAGFCVTIPLVFVLENYWALVAGMLATKLYGLVASYVLHPFRPKFSFSAASKLFNFSKWLLISNFLYFLRLKAADFVIGRLLGVASLGVYTIAFEISNMVTTELIAPINRAVYPGYSALKDDPKAFSDNFLMVVSYIAMFALPAGLGMAATAEIIVPVLLGDKWIEAIPLIKILAIYGAITAQLSNLTYVYLAIGKPQIATYMTTIFVATSLPLLVYFTLEEGAMGAAKAYLIASAAALPVYFINVCRHLKIRLIELLKATWRVITAASVMYFGVVYFLEWLTTDGSIGVLLVKMCASVALGGLLYSTTLYGLWRIDRSGKAEKMLFDKVGQYVGVSISRLRGMAGRESVTKTLE